MKQEKWWIVVINLGGITGPMCCYKRDDDNCWDRSGNWDCTMVEGVVGIGGKGSGCIQFQTKIKREAELFALGARELAKHLTLYLAP